jgi:hypothetical protein
VRETKEKFLKNKEKNWQNKRNKHIKTLKKKVSILCWEKWMSSVLYQYTGCSCPICLPQVFVCSTIYLLLCLLQALDCKGVTLGRWGSRLGQLQWAGTVLGMCSSCCIWVLGSVSTASELESTLPHSEPTLPCFLSWFVQDKLPPSPFSHRSPV